MVQSKERRRAVEAAYRKNVVGTRTQYNLRAYRRAAKAIASSGRKCVKCGKPATTANHRKLISKGGTMAAGLNAMCLKCASAQGGKAS
jgi:hypothetical protein